MAENVESFMGEYFKPLRTKFGMLTLVAACLFAAAWIRGHFVADSFQIIGATTVHHVKTSRLGLEWIYLWGETNTSARSYWNTTPVQVFIDHRKDIEEAYPQNLSFWNSLGFEGRRTHLSTMQSSFQLGPVLPRKNMLMLSIHYWSIIIPLTLLSAFLLRRKVRQLNQQQAAETVSEKIE